MRLALAFPLCFMICSCATGRDPIQSAPDVDIQEVLIETPCIVQIEAVEKAVLPEYPIRGDGDKKEWALKFREIYHKREALKDKEIESLRKQISKHNLIEPKCSGDTNG